MRHMFDGYGFLSRLRVQGGRAWGNQRYVQSKAYKAYTAQGKAGPAALLKLSQFQPRWLSPARPPLQTTGSSLYCVTQEAAQLHAALRSASFHSWVSCAVKVCCCLPQQVPVLQAALGQSGLWSP